MIIGITFSGIFWIAFISLIIGIFVGMLIAVNLIKSDEKEQEGKTENEA